MESSKKYAEGALKRIIRKANYKDLAGNKDFTDHEALEIAEKKVEQLKLKMRILKVEMSMGGNKVVVLFSAPDRVDFRELLKQLASSFKARVELKQVGSRDEAKIVGGVGICGREFCCSTFLREFVPVSIKMAKNQNLALNPSKVSGGCGRLLCCLTYENDVYTELRKTIPHSGTMVTYDGDLQGRVLRGDLLNQTVLIEDSQGMTLELSVSDIKFEKSKPRPKKSEKNHRDKNKPKKSDQKKSSDDWGKDIDLKELMKDPKKK